MKVGQKNVDFLQMANLLIYAVFYYSDFTTKFLQFLHRPEKNCQMELMSINKLFD